ncbi:MAG: hypothetical protein ACI91T_000978 [Natronomonas sp.]|jgi:hypothetical protein
MSDENREIGRMAVGLTADTVATAVIIVCGLAYLLAAALAPGLIGNVSTALSAGSMALIGLLLLWSVVRGSRLLTGLMALVEIGSMVGSWTGTIRWAVPYDPGLAAVSMAGVDFIVAVALVFKTIQLIDIELAPPPEP